METSGDPRRERFDALWAAHYGAILGYARRRCPAAAAADVAAEVFLVAWRRLDRVPADDPLPWLIGTARRSAANHARGERRRRTLARRLAGLRPETAPDPADLAGGVELRGAFATLRPAERELIGLAAWDGLTHSQIASVLGCSPGAVAVRLHRARERLRSALVADEPAAPAIREEGR